MGWTWPNDTNTNKPTLLEDCMFITFSLHLQILLWIIKVAWVVRCDLCSNLNTMKRRSEVSDLTLLSETNWFQGQDKIKIDENGIGCLDDDYNTLHVSLFSLHSTVCCWVRSAACWTSWWFPPCSPPAPDFTQVGRQTSTQIKLPPNTTTLFFKTFPHPLKNNISIQSTSFTILTLQLNLQRLSVSLSFSSML